MGNLYQGDSVVGHYTNHKSFKYRSQKPRVEVIVGEFLIVVLKNTEHGNFPRKGTEGV